MCSTFDTYSTITTHLRLVPGDNYTILVSNVRSSLPTNKVTHNPLSATSVVGVAEAKERSEDEHNIFQIWE
jgi:hypothetical protein